MGANISVAGGGYGRPIGRSPHSRLKSCMTCACVRVCVSVCVCACMRVCVCVCVCVCV